MPEPSKDLEPASSGAVVMDRSTGEMVSVRDADTERLAEFMTNQQHLRSRLSDAEAVVSQELVDRLDRSASWTLRVGDPKGDFQWEVTAPSPTAGTESYPPDVLERTLQALIMTETITPAAASKACRRQLVLTLQIPWSADLQDLADSVTSPDTVIRIGGVEVEVVKAEPSRRTVAAGISALRKVPGTVEALDAVKVVQSPAARRARVTVKTRSNA